MSSLWGALSGVFSGGGGEEVQFLSDVLKQYREIRRVYYYEYTQEDKEALKECATDLRPFGYSLLPATATFWGMGRMANPRQVKQLGLMTRAALLLLRMAAASEVMRVGYMVGSYRQGVDCTRRLVALRSPLGGEITAIIRERDPSHPLLKAERPPSELNEDGSRPRIVCEANRLAQIAHLKKELEEAKAGRAVSGQDYVNRSADEFLFSVMRQRERSLEAVREGGGVAGAAAGGSLEGARPAPPRSYREEYATAAAAGVSAAGGGGSLPRLMHGSSSSGGGGGGGSGGLVITDEAPPTAEASAQLQQHAAELAAAALGRRAAPGSDVAEPAAQQQQQQQQGDPLSMLLGDGEGGRAEGHGEEDEAAAAARAAEEARQRRREKRRKEWWRRKGGAGGEAESSW